MTRKLGRRREFERWPGLKKVWLHGFQRCVEARECAGLVQLFSSAEEWFEWWISDRAQEETIDEHQLYLDGFYEAEAALRREQDG